MEPRNYDGNAKLAELERNCEYAQGALTANLVSIEPKINEIPSGEQNINETNYEPVEWPSDVRQNLMFFDMSGGADEHAIFITMAAKGGHRIFDESIFVEGTLRRVLGFGLKV